MILFFWYGLIIFHKKGIDDKVTKIPKTNFHILMPEETAIETFDAFCVGTSYERSYELKINDPNKACLVKIRYKSDYFKATFQVDNGIPITKDQFLEITPLSKPYGWSRYYTYKILYKDENAKVGSAQIIFTNKQRSLEFGQALKRFGTD